MSSDKMPSKPISEHRRSNKPIMEKKRRARINNCLNELKNLLLEAMRKDPSRHSKLEKADILEMTVKHLQTLQRQQTALSMAADPGVVTKYRAGFNECAEEVSRYMSRANGIEQGAKQRLLNHLGSCLNGLGVVMTSFSGNSMPASSTISALAAAVASSSAANSTTTATTRSTASSLQLLPSRLSRGDIALLLPSQSSTNWSQLTSSPQFLPFFQSSTIPNRTNSGSSSSSPSSSEMAGTSPQTSPSTMGVNYPSRSTSSISDDDDHRFYMSQSPCSSTRSSSSPVLCDDDVISYDQFIRSGDRNYGAPSTVTNQRLCPQNGDLLMPVNLSKEADKMWRPW